MPFSSLPAAVGEALAERGYAAPTDVQAAIIVPETAGRDLLVSAQTGSGKTVAYGLAMVAELLGGEERFGFAREPLALIIAPTRELAMQVQRELAWLYGKAGGRVASCVGGMNVRQEQRALQSGAHIVVGTPGRLRDHLERGSLITSGLKVVVLDEADEMLDLGFREDIEEILDVTPADRRTLLFSATIPKPIANLAKTYQKDALRIATASAGKAHADIEYRAIAVAPADIEHAVVNTLRFYEANGAMVFCATRENVRRLHASLVERGFSAVALSGELSQNERTHALQALRDRRARVCVATDVAARGIDLPDLGLVVHAEIPIDAETLQHRSGRTGRAGRKGICVMIVPYSRRRRAEGMLRSNNVNAQWVEAPTPEDIRAKDQERLLETITPGEAMEEDLVVARQLLERHSAEEIAAALVRSARQRLPEPEDLFTSGADERPAKMEGPRPGFEDTVWFRMNVGRNNGNADARWILPLLCRRGHITKSEIGAIRIGDRETLFQIPRGVADRFNQALKKTASPEDDVAIEAAGDAPPPVQGGRRRPNGPNNGPSNGPPRNKYAPKPYRKTNDRHRRP
ncbi:DEAD/DEAH box helicase [Sphingobium boeckii]|uniref:ATP-dependent RNA helicase DeaD n=1 Tax=Sphingobium boeckii TaxID=1082345 RepID=A0A7W9AK88_9SPHN|nr:DEAD/DEAH box helicase [Sphingobium boeckii]MBB5687233.1 ATP-dependent RNA helicase DeaD [Sphingobium boeckii]